jgi:hypothetical protein
MAIAINRAIKKYGKQNFKKDVLQSGLNRKDAYVLEKILTDLDAEKDPMSYNIKIKL